MTFSYEESLELLTDKLNSWQRLDKKVSGASTTQSGSQYNF